MLFSLMLNVISMAFILQIYSVFCYFPNFLEFFFCYAHDFSYLCRIICEAVRTMERKEFESYMQKYADQIEAIRQSAHKLHQSVNQTYGDQLPYGFHLDMVVQGIRDFGHLVCVREADVLPLFFGGYYHDSIEDARLTYNDVMKVARGYLTEEQAFLATEIAYALTNDKGRTRAERAGEKYYKGIRLTPYAPFVKLCDRLANISYSCSGVDSNNLRMKEVYKAEMPHFLQCINPHSEDPRFLLPQETVLRLAECLIDDLEREEREGKVWWVGY